MFRWITLGSAMALSASALASEFDAHQHGHANLSLVVENNQVMIEFESPAMNLVGFEHAPSTDSDKKLVAAALDQLHHPEELFVIKGKGQCEWQDTKVSTSMAGVDEHHDEHHGEHHDDEHHDDHHDDEHHDDHHDDEHHDDHHDDEHHDDHKDEHHHDDHADHEGESHSEFMASYQLTCKSADKIQSLDVQLFSLFKGIAEIEVQMIGPKGQNLKELTSGETRIVF